MYSLVRRVYIRLIRCYLSTPLAQQRAKLVWDLWGYWPILRRPLLLARFLRIDWNVPHAHKPIEMARLTIEVLRRGRSDAIVEAGCWQGGSTAKLSLLAARVNAPLHVFDSFQGVEPIGVEAGEHYDYSGEYRASAEAVLENVRRYGIKGLHLHPGWFADTVSSDQFDLAIGVVFIDCDLAKGTAEVITGLAPALSEDALVFTQDWQVRGVRELLGDSYLWAAVGLRASQPEHVGHFLARVQVAGRAAPVGHDEIPLESRERR